MSLCLRLGALAASAALAAFLGFTISAATASPIQKSQSGAYWVSYADLDLTRSEDVLTLEARIKTAARQLCRPTVARSALDQREASLCMQTALERAQEEVRQAMTTAHGRAPADRRAGAQR